MVSMHPYCRNYHQYMDKYGCIILIYTLESLDHINSYDIYVANKATISLVTRPICLPHDQRPRVGLLERVGALGAG